VVESGPKDDLFAAPSHPYTGALLGAIPVLGEKVDRLQSVDGEPPNPLRLPAGCLFHPRCESAMDICTSGDAPPTFQLSPTHRVSYWLREEEHVGNPVGNA